MIKLVEVKGYKCEVCGYGVRKDDIYCSKCGTRLDEKIVYEELEVPHVRTIPNWEISERLDIK